MGFPFFINDMSTENLKITQSLQLKIIAGLKKRLNFNRGTDEIDPFIGYSLIYHNTDDSSSDIVKKYYDKEIIERAFKQIKGILNLRPIMKFLVPRRKGYRKIRKYFKLLFCS